MNFNFFSRIDNLSISGILSGNCNHANPIFLFICHVLKPSYASYNSASLLPFCITEGIPMAPLDQVQLLLSNTIALSAAFHLLRLDLLAVFLIGYPLVLVCNGTLNCTPQIASVYSVESSGSIPI